MTTLGKTTEKRNRNGREKCSWPEGRESRRTTGREEATRGGREGSERLGRGEEMPGREGWERPAVAPHMQTPLITHYYRVDPPRHTNSPVRITGTNNYWHE